MSLRYKFGVVALSGVALLLLATCIHAFLPAVATSKLARVTPGTTRADAERILGRPVQILIPSAFGAETWRYEVSLRFGWVDVFFDDQGRVIEHNYERF
jgi:outer membrane protein assembly factor BamE (lipoprotein component of BamABCDE complex)